MKARRFLALLLALTMLLCACSAAGVQGAEGNFGTQVDKKQVITQITPAVGETVTLVSNDLVNFMKGHGLGKGLGVAGSVQEDMNRPLTLTWQCDKANKGYTVRYATKTDFSDVVEVKTEEATLVLDALFTGTTYYWQVVTHMESGDNCSNVYSFTTANTPRLIALPGATNTRDSGGYLTVDKQYRMKQGMIYRGARLEELESEGRQRALQVYKIKTDLDLRKEGDWLYTGESSPLGDGVNYVNIMVRDYTGAFTYKDEMRDAIRVFADEKNYPVYVHCSAGRDRTGTLLFLIGALCNIPEESLYLDYELTYLSPNSYERDDLTGHNSFLKFLELLNEYEGQTINEKAVSYCKEIGVTEEQIQSIRSILLEKIG